MQQDTSLRQYAHLLATYLKPQWPKASFMTFLLLSAIGLELWGPQLLGQFIDAIQAGQTIQTLTRVAMLFLVVVITREIINAAALYFSEDVGWTAMNNLRADLAEHVLNLDLSFHNNHTPGEMIERLDGDVTALAEFFSTFVVRIFGTFVLLTGLILLLFRIDWRIGLTLILHAGLTIVVLYRVQLLGVPHFRAIRQAMAELSSFWEEILAGLEDIRSNGAETYTMRQMYRLMRQVLRRGRNSQVMGSLMFSAAVLMFALSYALIFGLGAYLFALGLLTLGSIYVVIRYTELLGRNLAVIAFELDKLQRATASIQRINEMYYTQSKIITGSGLPLPEGALSISFDQVTFAYKNDESILQNLSFDLAAGKVLGLLGRTGSGKTTMTRMLFRFFDPNEGQIRVGNVDLQDVGLTALRRRIGVVTQQVQLFNATVRDNLSFFDPTISDERILWAITQLELSDWFDKLPQGLDTVLSFEGGGLSAGEAQLLALTRVFLRDPSLVILDEASSRLDPATEQLIQQAVDRLLDGRTGIIIAHRLATVHRADEILILHEGQIREYGERVSLMQNPESHFSTLLRTGMEALA